MVQVTIVDPILGTEQLLQTPLAAHAPIPGQALPSDEKDALLLVARQTLVWLLNGHGFPQWTTDAPALQMKRAVFVTLRERDTGNLRGCRGECETRRPLIDAVAHMAAAAAFDDPRFDPVRLRELPNLHIEINLLSPLQEISPRAVEVGRHGLLIRARGYAGLLLPEVPVRYDWNRLEFLQALCHKAGLPVDAWCDPQTQLLAFETEEWAEK